MGSKGRIPPPHFRRPPPGPGMMHPEPFGPGMHSMPGGFPHLDMLPPPEVLEQKLAAQHVEMQKLATENQRLATTHGTLRQELAAAQHELQMLHSQIGAMKAEREQQKRNLLEKIAKMENDLQAAEPVKSELKQATTDAQKLALAREELIAKVHKLTQDLQRAHADVQQLPAMMSELDSLRQEYQHCRNAYEYEKKFYNDHLESLKVMENNYITMSREVEKLRAELANASNIDRRTGGQFGGATGSNEKESSGYSMGQNAYEDGYGGQQVPVPPNATGAAPAGANVSASAGTGTGTPTYVGAQSRTPPARTSYEAQITPGYDASKGPSYDASRGQPGYDTQRMMSNYNAPRVPGYDAQRGPPIYDAPRGLGYDMQRGHGYEPQRGPGYDAQRGGGYVVQRGQGYDGPRGPNFDTSRGANYDSLARGGSGPHG